MISGTSSWVRPVHTFVASSTPPSRLDHGPISRRDTKRKDAKNRRRAQASSAAEFGDAKLLDRLIVAAEMTAAPTIVIGHSLGSVVAFNVLRKGGYDVPLVVTLGSPLGINAVRSRVSPIAYPGGVRGWVNLYGDRHIVDLRPLDGTCFRVDPEVRNIPGIDDNTDNRHGIPGYLRTVKVANAVPTALHWICSEAPGVRLFRRSMPQAALATLNRPSLSRRRPILPIRSAGFFCRTP